MFAPKVAKAQMKAADDPTSKMTPHRSTVVGHRLGHDPVEQVLFLQRSIGNQAILRLLGRQMSRPAVSNPPSDYEQGGGATENAMTGETSRGASWDFSKIPIFSPDRTNRPQASPQLTLPGIIQPKLFVGRVDDPLEREADAVADRVMRMSDPALSISSGPPQISGQCAECEEEDKKKLQTKPGGTVSPVRQAPSIVQEVLREPGQPLAAETRRMMESRFTRAFGDVRVHKDPRAAGSAAAVNALAYTVGRHVVFGDGQFAPETMAGRRLLAHELAHVVQQSGGAAGQVQRDETTARELKIGPADSGYERRAHDAALQYPAPEGFALTPLPFPALQRQPAATPATQPAGSPFSVVQADYLKLVNQALQNMSGGIIGSNTLAGPIQSMLQPMVAQVTWRDANGKEQGGAAIKHQLPGTPPLTLNLRLVLDDMANPPDGGRFEKTGKTDGKIIVRIRNNPTADELTKTLFHEGLHLMSEIINELGATQRLGAQDRLALRGLTLRMFQPTVNATRNQLDMLAKSVNARRKAAGQSQITSTGLDKMAPWLVEEVLVRAETEVFRLYSEAQRIRASRGPTVMIGTATSGGQSIDVNLAMVHKYVFQFSNQFQPGDESSLSNDDKQLLVALSQMFDGLFQLQVKKRFSVVLWTMSVTPERPQFVPPPLTPPASFGPPPLPP
jgi:hypothetical protein